MDSELIEFFQIFFFYALANTLSSVHITLCICRGPTFIYGNGVIEDDMIAEKLYQNALSF